MAQALASVLFVCLGNICRSPTAEAVFRHKAKEKGLPLEIDSAGTAGYHTGSLPDQRSQAAGEARGYSFAGLSCRKVEDRDFEVFDYILAMDENNFDDLHARCPDDHKSKVSLFMAFSELDEDIVPDPYYGGLKGFEYVLDLIEDASEGLLDHIHRQHR